jgi:hypothetical protein
MLVINHSTFETHCWLVLLQSPRTHCAELGTLARFAALVAGLLLRQRGAEGGDAFVVPLCPFGMLDLFPCCDEHAAVLQRLQRLLGGFA